MLNTKKLFKKILDAINPSSNTVCSFTVNSKFTNRSGGAWKIGKLIFVNMKVTVSGAFAANDYYTVSNNFPVPNVNSALTVSTPATTGNKGAVAVIDTSGALVVQSGANALTDLQIFITGIYLGGGI